jgi:beta-lactamase regulating signal transducer with metallopeptidase domain
MEGFCCTLLSMSLAAALTALGVMVARLFLYKLPRALICGLWLVVLFRMACPVSVSLPVGLVPQGVADGSTAQFVLSSSRPLPSGAQVAPPTGGTPEGRQTAPAPEDSPSETAVAETPHWPAIAFGVWAAGAAVAALWGVVTYCRLRKRIDDAVLLSEHIYETDQIDSPFVLGFFRPRIYLPVGLTEQERRYVLLHEQAHIRRWDHRFKPLAYALLCLHWFNPVLWIAYRLLCLDIEMATDQAVLRRLDHEEHTSPTEYAAALLHLSRDPRVPSAVPLAFGEEDAKERIVSLLRYRRPMMGVLVAAALVCLVLGVGFAGNHSTAAPALGLTRITQGTLTGATGPVALTEEQQREVVELLNHTKKSSYTPCEDPGRPEGTVSLSNQDGSVEYRLLFQGTDLPRLVQVRNTGETRTCRSAAFSYSEAGDFLGGDRKNLIQKWSAWCYEADVCAFPDRAGQIYAARVSDAADPAACEALLKTMDLERTLGPYTVTSQPEGQGCNIVLALTRQPPDAAARERTNRWLTLQGSFFLALAQNATHFSWYYPDGAGKQAEPLRGWEPENVTQDIFFELYSHRDLWWWDALCLNTNCFYYLNWEYQVEVHHPGYAIAEILYNGRPDLLDQDCASFYFLPTAQGESFQEGSYGYGTDIQYQPLQDLTCPDPEDPTRDLLADRGIREGYAVCDEWEGTLRDSGDHLYIGQDGLYYANSISDETGQRELRYLFRLRETEVGFGWVTAPGMGS